MHDKKELPIYRDVYEVVYVLDGHGRILLQEEERLLPGDTLLLPPGTTRRLVSMVSTGSSDEDCGDSEFFDQVDAFLTSHGSTNGGSVIPPASSPSSQTPTSSLIVSSEENEGAPPQGSFFGLASIICIVPNDLFLGMDDADEGESEELPSFDEIQAKAKNVVKRVAHTWHQGESVGELTQQQIDMILSSHMNRRASQERLYEFHGGKSPTTLTQSGGSLFEGITKLWDKNWLGVPRLLSMVSSSSSVDGEREQGAPPPHRHFSSVLGKAPLADNLRAVRHKALGDVRSFEFPNQTNRLALTFDPLAEESLDRTPFTFGIECFEPGHKTTPHSHERGHEVFVLLAGTGEAFCDEERFPVGPGDVVSFPPHAVHGIDVDLDGPRMYCVTTMLPNDAFAEFVRTGRSRGSFTQEDLCVMLAVGCGDNATTS
jgi:quercetin dioxygenase-like cupin family protein